MRPAWRHLILLILLVIAPCPARPDTVVADLSSHSIGITTGFNGAAVVLFGATDGPGDVIAVVRGPERELTIWRKGKIAGIWANAESVTFANIPSFYLVAASRPLEDIIGPSTATLYRIGVNSLRYETRPSVAPERVQLFAQALINAQQRSGLFGAGVNRIAFLGERLFRTTLTFPANVPTGSYLIEIFLVRDKEIVGGQTTPLNISKVGVDAKVFDFAQQSGLAYGAIAVVTAVMAGWLASLPFRNA